MCIKKYLFYKQRFTNISVQIYLIFPKYYFTKQHPAFQYQNGYANEFGSNKKLSLF